MGVQIHPEQNWNLYLIAKTTKPPHTFPFTIYLTFCIFVDYFITLYNLGRLD